MTGITFKTTMKGDFRAVSGAAGKASRMAATGGMKATTRQLTLGVRAQVKAAGLGTKVANSVRDVVYPKSGTSLSPAGVVFSKAPQILRGFEDGSMIRAKGRGFLTIPTKDCPYGRGGGHIKPKEAVKRFKTFRFQRAADGTLLMMFEVASSQDGLGWKRATKQRNQNQRRRSGRLVKPRAAQWVAFYFLVPSARLRKKLNVDGVLRQIGARLNANIVAAWPQNIEAL
ncbi:hypothetical protein sos41_11840 [Alphaproteobacteria bacterium SO-S41]|nr:hypothetical protein sos41_11840 [Alphaproteobacteria bacterium SO-S41]